MGYLISEPMTIKFEYDEKHKMLSDAIVNKQLEKGLPISKTIAMGDTVFFYDKNGKFLGKETVSRTDLPEGGLR